MSNQSKGRVQCPKCMGNRYIPIRSGSTSVRSCDRCGADGWVEDTADQNEDKMNQLPHNQDSTTVHCVDCGWHGAMMEAEIIHSFTEGFLKVCPKCVCLEKGKYCKVQEIDFARPFPLNPLAGPMPEGWPERQRAMGEAFSKAIEKMHSPKESAAQTPPHYRSSSGTTPWDLQRGMKSSGNAFVDGRRCDAIKYAFRVKQNMAEDLRKAAHCLMEAVAVLEAGGDKSAVVDRILDEVFNPPPLGTYNDWAFWKRESKDTPWVAELNGIMLFRRTKEELFASIEAENAKRKETA